MKIDTSRIKFLSLIGFTFLIIYSCEVLPDDEALDNASRIEDTWRCTESSSIFGTTSYTCDIVKDSTQEDRVHIYNFYQLGFDVSAIVNLSNRNLYIPSQTIDGITISGSGYIQTGFNSIELSFTADDNDEIDNVSLSLSRIY